MRTGDCSFANLLTWFHALLCTVFTAQIKLSDSGMAGETSGNDANRNGLAELLDAANRLGPLRQTASLPADSAVVGSQMHQDGDNDDSDDNPSLPSPVCLLH